MENLLFKIEIAGVTEQVERLGQLRDELMQLRKAQSELDKDFKAGTVDTQKYHEQTGILQTKMQMLSQETSQVKKTIDSQNAAYKAAEGSMTKTSQELGRLRQQYRDLSGAERENVTVGGVLLNRIQTLDAEIKRQDASIGNYQRSVGNYTMIVDELNKRLATEKQRFAALSVEQQKNAEIGGVITANINRLESEVKQANASINELTRTSGGFVNSFKDFAKQAVFAGGAIGIAIMAFGKLKEIMSEAWQGAVDDEKAFHRLTFALNGNAEAAKRMTEWKDRLRFSTTFTEEDINSVTNYALSLGKTEAETMKLVKASMALSQASNGNISLTVAMDRLLVSLTGRDLELKKYVGDLTQEQLKNGDAIDKVLEKYSRFITEGMDQTAGKLKTAKDNWEEFLDSIGNKALGVFDRLYTRYFILVEQFKFLKENYGTWTAITAGASMNTVVDKNYFEWKKQQLEKIALIKLENEANKKLLEDIKTGKSQPWKTTPKDDEPKTDNTRKESESINRAYENAMTERAAMLAKNAEYIIKLTQDTIAAQIEAMNVGKEKELAIENKSYAEKRTNLLNEQNDLLSAVDTEIKAIENKGAKKTEEERKQLEALKNQRIDIIGQTDAVIEAQAILHNQKLKSIDEKYSKETADKKISEKYGSDVAALQEDYNQKLQLSQQYYAELGTLTKEQSEQQKREELKLTLDLYQKRYDLLYAEIQARKALGNVTKEEYEAQLRELALLYNQVRKIQNQAKPGEEEKDSTWRQSDVNAGVGSGLATMASNLIGENMSAEAALILNKTAELLDNIQGLWLQSQQERIEAELRAETKKLDKLQKQELKDLQQKRKRGLITEEKYEEEKEAIDQKYEAAKLELQKEAFEKNKRLQIANAIMSGAVAVVNALQTTPIWLGILMAVITGALVAVQIASIASQKFTGARGGMIEGKSHAQGGEKYYSDDQDVELEGGEAVINKKSINDDKTYTFTGTPRQIASAINSLDGNGVEFDKGAKEVSLEDIRAKYVRGGLISEPFSFIGRRTNYDPGITPMKIRFDAGGYMPAPTPRRIIPVHESSDILGTAVSETTGRLAEKLVGAINDQKVIVVESEMTEIQDKVKKIKIESKW